MSLVLILILFCSWLHFSSLHSWDEYNSHNLLCDFHFSVQHLLRPVFALPSFFNFSYISIFLNSHWRLLYTNTNFSLFNEKKAHEINVPSNTEIKLIIVCSLKKWSKGWEGQVEIIFPQTHGVLSLTGSLASTLCLFLSLNVLPLILMLYLILMYYQQYSSQREKKIGLLYEGV